VLEVGLSTGNLTVKILEQAKQATAIDMDPTMAAKVTKRVQGTYVFTLIFNFLLSIFYSVLPRYFRHLIFLFSNAGRLTENSTS